MPLDHALYAGYSIRNRGLFFADNYQADVGQTGSSRPDLDLTFVDLKYLTVTHSSYCPATRSKRKMSLLLPQV